MSLAFLAVYNLTLVDRFTAAAVPFIPIDLQLLSYGLGLFLSSLVGVIVRPRIESVADAVTVPLGYVGIIPSIWMLLIFSDFYGIDGQTYSLALTAGFALLVLTSRLQLRWLPPSAPLGQSRGDRILIFAALTALAWTVVGFGLSLQLHSLIGDAIYAARLEHRSVLVASIPLANEAMFSLGFFLAPLLLLRGIEHRRSPLILVGALCSVVVYSISAQRSPLVVTVLALGIYLGRDLVRNRFARTVSVAMLVMAAIDMVRQIPLLTEVGFRRIVAIPALATVWYFDFQADFEPTYMRDSLLPFLGSSPYDSSIPREIGRAYTWSGVGESLNNANTGVFGSSVTTFGLFGLILVPVILGIYLALVDGIGGTPSTALVCVTAAFTLMILLNGSLLVAMISNGLCLLLPWRYLEHAAQRAPDASHQHGRPLRHAGIERVGR